MKNPSCVLFFSFYIVVVIAVNRKNSNEFIHPGLLHTTTDLQRMKTMVAQQKQPWYAAFQSFAASDHSTLNYKIQGPDAVVTRDVNPKKENAGTIHLVHDSVAALQLALMYSITGNESYAALSTKILEDWTNTLIIINGIV